MVSTSVTPFSLSRTSIVLTLFYFGMWNDGHRSPWRTLVQQGRQRAWRPSKSIYLKYISRDIHMWKTFSKRVKLCKLHQLRLVSVVVLLYLTLAHVTSAFSLPLTHQRSSNRLQHPGYSPSVSAFSLTINTIIPDFIILEFIFWQQNWENNCIKI
jgi:hypothetical protein